MQTFTKFQFHKGAIGVMTISAVAPQIYVFQFHKGAIGVFQKKYNFNDSYVISIP